MAEENISNNQSFKDKFLYENSVPSANGEWLFSQDNFYNLYSLFLLKEYTECYDYLESNIEKKELLNTPLSLSLIAIVHYENLQYVKARIYFEKIMDLFPNFLKEVLYYSSFGMKSLVYAIQTLKNKYTHK